MSVRLCCLASRIEAERERKRADALDARLDRVQRALEAAEGELHRRYASRWEEESA